MVSLILFGFTILRSDVIILCYLSSDGICCSYGSGSYSVAFGGTKVASGGAFTSAEVKSIGSRCGSLRADTPAFICGDIAEKNQCNKSATCAWSGNGINGDCIKALKPELPVDLDETKCLTCRATGQSCCGICQAFGPKASRGCFF